MSIKTANRPFRKTLMRDVRAGKLTRVHLVGTKGNWALTVKRGSNLFVLASGFATQTAANIRSMMKLGRKATVLKIAA